MFTFAFKCLTLCTGENCVSSNMNVDERMQFEATILTKTIPCLSSANNITASAKRCSKRVREPVPEKPWDALQSGKKLPVLISQDTECKSKKLNYYNTVQIRNVEKKSFVCVVIERGS